MSIVIDCQQVNKRFMKKVVLHDLELQVESGKIIALLGENGSGKSTLLKLLAGLSYPNSGTIEVLGFERPQQFRTQVVYLPDKNIVPSGFTIEQAVAFYNDLFPQFSREKAGEILAFMDVDTKLCLKNLSKGMLERVNLSLTFAQNADLYLLDEPLGGIDVIARDKILAGLLNFIDETSTVIIATHLIRDIEMIIDEAVFLKDGAIIHHLASETIRENYQCSITDFYKQIFEV